MASAWAGSIWLRPRVASGSPARSTRTPVNLAGLGASAETSRTSSPSTTISPSGRARTNSDRSGFGVPLPRESREAAARPFGADARRELSVRGLAFGDSKLPLPFDARTGNVSDSTRPLSSYARASDGAQSLTCARTEKVSDSTRPLSSYARASVSARTGNVSDSTRPLSAVARASDGAPSLICARTGNVSDSMRPLSAVARASDGAPSLICARTENVSDSTRLLSTDARTSGRETFRAQVSSPFRVRRARKCPSPSMRCGHRRRQPSCDAPTPGRSKASGSKSGCARRNSRTVPSFSSRLNVHVEYTSFPPGRTMRAASFRIAVWRAAQPAGASGFHWDAASGSRRNMPSPEQGASTSTRSKNAGSARASASAGAEVTNAFVTPSRSRLPSRMRARENSISLESRKPRPFSRAAICPLLPPGAAHRSSTRSPGRGSSAATGAIADASCR